MPAASLPWTEIDRLAALRSYHFLDTAFEETCDNFARLAAEVTGCPTGLVTLVDEQRKWFTAVSGTQLKEVPRATAFCAYAILQAKNALVVPDATADNRFSDNPLVTGEPRVRFYAGVPLITAEGHALGTLCVLDYVPRQLAPLAMEAVEHLAKAVMTTLQLRREIAVRAAQGMFG